MTVPCYNRLGQIVVGEGYGWTGPYSYYFERKFDTSCFEQVPSSLHKNDYACQGNRTNIQTKRQIDIRAI